MAGSFIVPDYRGRRVQNLRGKLQSAFADREKPATPYVYVASASPGSMNVVSHLPRPETLVGENFAAQRDRRLDRVDDEFVQRAFCRRYRLATRWAIHDQLAHQAVIGGRNLIALVDVTVPSHAKPAGPRRPLPARAWPEIVRGILGVDSALDGAPALHEVFLLEVQLLAAAMRICHCTRSKPVNHLGNRVAPPGFGC